MARGRGICPRFKPPYQPVGRVSDKRQTAMPRFFDPSHILAKAFTDQTAGLVEHEHAGGQLRLKTSNTSAPLPRSYSCRDRQGGGDCPVAKMRTGSVIGQSSPVIGQSALDEVMSRAPCDRIRPPKRQSQTTSPSSAGLSFNDVPVSPSILVTVSPAALPTVETPVARMTTTACCNPQQIARSRNPLLSATFPPRDRRPACRSPGLLHGELSVPIQRVSG